MTYPFYRVTVEYIWDTLNSEWHLTMLNHSALPTVSLWDSYLGWLYTHDGTPPHFVLPVCAWLENHFSGHWMRQMTNRWIGTTNLRHFCCCSSWLPQEKCRVCGFQVAKVCAICWGLFLLITNLTHFFTYLFISSHYMFRASQCSSSGDQIVLIHHPVWLVCVSDCLVCQSGGNILTGIPCSNTIRSPDDEHCDARNM